MNDIRFRFRHMMLPVKDLERSIDFYTRLLGMGIARRRVSEEDNIKAVFLCYGEEQSQTALELVEKSGPRAPARMNPWDGHISIQVSDLFKLCGNLERADVKFIKLAGPIRPERKALLAIILDPDGYQIALTQRQ